MRTGRPTQDKKDFTVKLRINEDTKRWLDMNSARNGMSVSEFIREIISKAMVRA